MAEFLFAHGKRPSHDPPGFLRRQINRDFVEDGRIRFGQNASDLFSFVPLDFNLAILNRAACSTRLLHDPGQAFFLRQTDAGQVSGRDLALVGDDLFHLRN